MTKLALIALSICLLSGCLNITPVKAWHRGKLAKPEMAWATDPLNGTLSNHIYFAKEGSSGGGSASGGGCGCN
jgi:hypothetical protein